MLTDGRRPLDPAEQYFLLCAQLIPMNAMAIAQWGQTFDPELVRDAWQRVSALEPVARTRYCDGPPLHLEAGPPDQAADFQVVPARDAAALIQSEQDVPFDDWVAPHMRCRYAVHGDSSASLLLIGDHTVVDGQTLLLLQRKLLREMTQPGSGTPGGFPPPMSDYFLEGRRWADDRSAMLKLLQTMSAERQHFELLPCPWHDRSAGDRESSIVIHQLTTKQSAAVLARAKALGATVHGVTAATLLQTVHELYDDGRPSHDLILSSPADMRRRLSGELGTSVLGMFTSVISTTHRVRSGPIDELARDVSSEIRRLVDRGDGEAFFVLTHAHSVPVERGRAWADRAIGAAPTSLAVSNLGIIADSGDPEWVESMSAMLSPTSNQLAFATVSTYRGRLTITMSIDRRRIRPEHAEKLTDFSAFRAM